MSHTKSLVVVHLVFGTKRRAPYLKKEFRPEIHRYMGSLVNEAGCRCYAVGGVKDHVHILFRLSVEARLKDVVRHVKANSSRWIKTLDADLSGFAWQGGYGAFSVSQSSVARVFRYIQNQERHHARQTFEEEMKTLLEKHGLSGDDPDGGFPDLGRPLNPDPVGVAYSSASGGNPGLDGGG